VSIELKPETERLVQEEIQLGHFRSVDDMILQGLTAWREKYQSEPPAAPRKRLYDLLSQPPFAGSNLQIERAKDHPRPVDLG
jgi:Arc/MetJ-type ribon-helix-helix transcriptional regulator